MKNKYLKYCTYYHGEETCPEYLTFYQNGTYLWDVEMRWVNDMLQHGEKYGAEGIWEYNYYVNPKVDEKYGLPISLLGCIFHRISKWAYSCEDLGKTFAEYIEKEYLNPTYYGTLDITQRLSYNDKTFQYYLDRCRYYKGESEVPEHIQQSGKDIFWKYEQWWVMQHFVDSPNQVKECEKSFKDLIRDYKKNGLGQFSKDDGVPIALKAILFNRHAHHAEGMFTIDEFQKGYIENYLGQDFNTTKEKILYKKYI